eukprot:CAMPEP_0206268684 /NCGR_PEP_ID=MMETSP0047_2-20121206/31852_1 /ASSEMBLY_ACC=CAM_ASM_000192 /TAXON_ID=195065 /ORGANISM="Chroomonas mesostigmatica_cf, Strain CCMP1168" /LENGTH=355 /DNA_ID=CAMNT_0053697047 /DNA_START=56 /DNA_END=1121 /DNA_ORIENTATION=-
MPILTHQQATLCVLAAVALIPTSHAFGAGAPVLAGGLRGALPPLRARRAVAPLAGGARMQDTSFFSKFARTIVEKAKADVERTKRLFNGLEGLRSEMSVIDELLSYWQLADADKTLEQLEEALIMRDFGVSTSVKICEGLAEEVKSGKIKQPKDLRNAMKAKIVEILHHTPAGRREACGADDGGVNGGGKTTTVGKLSSKFAKEGKSVMLAAGDTFRAAADLQLEEWCQRAGATMAPRSNAKSPAAVMYDAIDASISSGTDVLIADTSGRLHTNANLMAELQKVKGVFDKKMPGKPKEILLVVDSTQGQNVLNQARGFNEAVGITGVVLTKLDGTSKGGVVVSIVDELKVPVKFI